MKLEQQVVSLDLAKRLKWTYFFSGLYLTIMASNFSMVLYFISCLVFRYALISGEKAEAIQPRIKSNAPSISAKDNGCIWNQFAVAYRCGIYAQYTTPVKCLNCMQSLVGQSLSLIDLA